MLIGGFVWEKVLSPSETIKYEFSIGTRYCIIGFIFWLISSFLIAGLMLSVDNQLINTLGPITAIALIIFAIFFYGFYLRIANMYAFTDKRVVIHRGWLSTHTVSIDYERITDTIVRERFIENLIMGTGDILINTAGTGEYEVSLTSIAHPYEVKKKLDEIRNSRMERYLNKAGDGT